MLFNSFAYLIFFGVVMLGAKLLVHRRYQHFFLLIASVYVAINLLIDLSYVFLDPRIRY